MGSMRTVSAILFLGFVVGVFAAVTLAVGNARVGTRLHPNATSTTLQTNSGVTHCRQRNCTRFEKITTPLIAAWNPADGSALLMDSLGHESEYGDCVDGAKN